MLKSALRGQRAVIGIPEKLAKTRQGQVGLITAVNILTRLGALAPNLYLDVPKDVAVLPRVPLLPAGQGLGDSLLTLMRELATFQADNPERCYAEGGQNFEAGLFIGNVTSDAAKAVTIGSQRWLAAINPEGVTENIDPDEANPFGIILAAALGSIELVKHMWLAIKDRDVVMEPLTKRIVMSAFDFRVNAQFTRNPDLPRDCNLGHVCVLGLGAIGSGCNYILGCLPELEMSLDLVDPDVIELSNEERLFTSADPKRDIRQAKVVHAQGFITGLQKKVKAFAYRMPFERYVDMSRDRLGYVWCCLDSAQARRLLQTELASVLVNGGTDMSRWMLSLHEHNRPENACLQDLYPEPSLDFVASSPGETGLSDIGPELARRVANGGWRFDAGAVALARQRQQAAPGRRTTANYATLTVRQVLSSMCGQVSPTNALPAATISFVSLMPAVFMVADLVKRRMYNWRLDEGAPNVFQFDSFRSPDKGTICNIRAAKECMCQSQGYQTAFRRRHQWRLPHLNRLFQAPAAPSCPRPAPQPQPVAAVSHAGANVAAQRNGENPVIRPAGQLQPREADRVQSVLLWLIAIVGYLGGMAVSMWLIGLFIKFENSTANTLQFWRLIPLAWKVQVSERSWIKYAAISALPVVAYRLLMHWATDVMRRARILYHGGDIAGRRNIHTRSTAAALSCFFAVTGLPCVSVGSVAFGAISLRALGEGCRHVSEQTCCFVVPFLLLGFGFLPFICLGCILHTLNLTWERCAKVFNVPLRRRKR